MCTVSSLKSYFPLSLILVSLYLMPSVSFAITDTNQMEGVGIVEELGKSVPMNIPFTNENGDQVKIGDFFDGKRPVILNLAYLNCPRVCTFAINDVLNVVNNLDSLKLGKDYRVITMSFNPDEDYKLAHKKADEYRSKLKENAPDSSWRFLTGEKKNLKEFTKKLGYHYKRDGKEYAHPTALIILTPDGTVSRYLYGIEHNTQDLKLSLLEAADGKIGSSETLNKVLLFCYEFDPVGKKYALRALNIVKAGGVVTLLFLGVFLTVMWKKENKHS